MTELRRCPHCGGENSATAKFCRNCGQMLAPQAGLVAGAVDAGEKVCSACNSSNPPDAGFCGNCGSALDEVVVERQRKLGVLPAFAIVAILLTAAALLFLLREPSTEPEVLSQSSGAADGKATTPTADSSAIVSEATETVHSSSLSTDAAETAVGVMTVTPPTLTPLPSPTASPIPSPTATLYPSPTASVAPSPTAVVVRCSARVTDDWPATADSFDDRLGCAKGSPGRPESAIQYFERGTAVWRRDARVIYFLYDNTGTYDVYRDNAPEGYYDSDLLKGAFGYHWNNDGGLRDRLGQPIVAEFNGSNFAVQDFDGGTVLGFDDNGTNIYVLLSDKREWVRVQ